MYPPASSHSPQRRTGTGNVRAAFLAALLACPLTAVASKKDDAEIALTEARSAVQAAERAGAPEQVPVEMKTARDSLDLAEQELDDREWYDARVYAERAVYDSRLAEARARQLRAEALTAEIEASVHSLQAEIAAGG